MVNIEARNEAFSRPSKPTFEIEAAKAIGATMGALRRAIEISTQMINPLAAHTLPISGWLGKNDAGGGGPRDRLQTHRLTPHQVDILKLAATGKTHLEIARSLPRQITKNTVKTIISGTNSKDGILTKLGVSDLTAAVVAAMKQGYLDYQTIEVHMIPDYEYHTREDTLSEKQRQVLVLKARGLTNKGVARVLNNIKPQSVKNMFSDRFESSGQSGIYEKLGTVSSQTAAVVRALQLGIIRLDEI